MSDGFFLTIIGIAVLLFMVVSSIFTLIILLFGLKYRFKFIDSIIKFLNRH